MQEFSWCSLWAVAEFTKSAVTNECSLFIDAVRNTAKEQIRIFIRNAVPQPDPYAQL
jgi:hypothetical protein